MSKIVNASGLNRSKLHHVFFSFQVCPDLAGGPGTVFLFGCFSDCFSRKIKILCIGGTPCAVACNTFHKVLASL